MPPFAEVRAWMFEAALPFWARAGVDRARGGFFEELDLAGQPAEGGFRRTRVICRQTYVFSHAALLGWDEGRDLSALGFDYLRAHAWLGPDKGWAKRLTPDGAVLDATPDLYDLAFVLFALAWRYRASGDRDALTLAHQTLDFIDAQMRPAAAPGFLHIKPPVGPRDQNPHMHLTEACLAAYEASGDQRFLDVAREIVGLFRRYFFDGVTLCELFTEDLQRAPGADARIEPGHQFEWAWILTQYQRLAHDDVSPIVRQLVGFAEDKGVDPLTGFTYMQVRADGAGATDKSSRSWPNTERIKGHLALFELGGHDPVPAVTSATRVLLDRYLNVSPRGSWIDVFDAHGQPASKAAPASTFYHVFLAFAELLRFEEKLSGAQR